MPGFSKSIRSLSIIIGVASVLFFMASCGGDYKKIQKSTNSEVKFNAAVAYYKAGNFLKALPLFESLLSVYRGTEKEQDVYYYYAYTNFRLNDFVMAGFYFSNFYHTFPHTTKAEECEFMHAYCEYLSSPIYNLDQTDSKKAIEAFQTFIDDYPASTRLKEANRYIDMMNSKLEKKYFEISKLYYTTEYYHAASVSLTNYVKSYPNSRYDEEACYIIIKADYKYAQNSVDNRKGDRLQTVIDAYLKFVDTYPKSDYLKDAQGIYDASVKMKSQLTATTKK
ncbi:MAG TPA: outer membrane protein assembly factor BamD [Bacteroidia bacterium]|nr:outer membrane protein assembly factor BamD [Bacteroidia bacterium]